MKKARREKRVLISIFISSCFSFLLGKFRKNRSGKRGLIFFFFLFELEKRGDRNRCYSSLFSPGFLFKKKGTGKRNRIHSAFHNERMGRMRKRVNSSSFPNERMRRKEKRRKKKFDLKCPQKFRQK